MEKNFESHHYVLNLGWISLSYVNDKVSGIEFNIGIRKFGISLVRLHEGPKTLLINIGCKRTDPPATVIHQGLPYQPSANTINSLMLTGQQSSNTFRNSAAARASFCNHVRHH